MAELSLRSRAVDQRVAVKLDRFRTDLEREPTPRVRWRLEREAVLDSRPAKTHIHHVGEEHEGWRTRATALGYEPHEIVAGTVGRVRRPAGIDQATMAQLVDGALKALRRAVMEDPVQGETETLLPPRGQRTEQAWRAVCL